MKNKSQDPILVSDVFLERYGPEALLIAGFIVSDGHPEDGQETYYWTNMAAACMRELYWEILEK